MVRILREVFDNVHSDIFGRDLLEKDWVILLKECKTEQVVGFSTLRVFDFTFDSQPIKVVFSGDTVILPQYWGSVELPLAWGSMMMSFYEADEAKPLYWMLISKGIRTFKYLPTFFYDYYPSPTCSQPESCRRLVGALSRELFGDSYDAEQGVILPNGKSYFLASALAEIPQSSTALPVTRYFLRKNPHYRSGAELACLARFEPSNLKPFFLRQIMQRREREFPRKAVISEQF